MQNEPFPRTEASQVPQEGRLYYLDWLRVLAILVVFFHHCAKLFDYHTFTIYNAVRSLTLSMFREFNFLWMMPLFFIISGASVYFSFGSRKAGGFIKERTLRILIPLIFVGTFLINAPQVYLERLLNGETVSSFFQWYPHFFEGMYLVAGGNFAPLGIGTHLWYLMYLFFFSLLLLPLFIPYGKTGTSALARLSRLFEKPWALFLLFVPVSATAAASEVMGIGITRYAGGWDPISFLVFFICGYLIFSNPRIQENIIKYSTISLIVAVILTILYLDSHFGINLEITGVTRHNLQEHGALLPFNSHVWMVVEAFRGLLAWSWIIGLLGLGYRFLNFKNRFLAYANEAVLPFYILHLTVILIIGYPVIHWDISICAKFFIIAVISFPAIMAIYELLVRRFNILRFLFGMKLKKRDRL